ncbi:hypothetical protein MKW94_017466, partial [Papaver nudicaule]|nr:hypothetical protein [Papaver nudicaule]
MFTISGETSTSHGISGYLDPRQSFNNGVILVEAFLDSYLYDPKHKTFTKLEINGCKVNSTWAYLGSLVSPDYIPNARGYQISEIIEAR